MLTNGIVTILKFDADAGEYVISGTYDAWVHLKEKTENTENGRKKASSLAVRIPIRANNNIIAATDDFIAPHELKAANVKECYLITGVTVNKFGGSPHIHIEADMG